MISFLFDFLLHLFRLTHAWFKIIICIFQIHVIFLAVLIQFDYIKFQTLPRAVKAFQSALMVSMLFELPSKWAYDWYKTLVTNYIFGALWFCYCCAFAFDLDLCRCWPKNLFISNAIIGFKIVVWFILLLADIFDLWFKYRRNALFFQSLLLKS